MKILPFKIPKPDHSSLVYQEDHGPHLYDKYHQHEEIQLSYILKGEGTLVVGDSVHHYQPNDILVLGSNLPHVFKSEVLNQKTSSMLTLFFNKEALGDHFLQLEEFSTLNKFLDESEYGLKVIQHKEALKGMFMRLKQENKLARFISLLKIIALIDRSECWRLSSFVYPKNYSDVEGKRLSRVFEYTMDNFDKPIGLSEIAGQANLTTNAFCKYFKQRTQKTYIQFLNEIRVEQACKLLINHSDLSVSEIAIQAGFNNISNFNRQFKRIKNRSPLKYREKSS